MHLFALDSNGSILPARLSEKGHDYRCLECNAKVRLRQGLHRQPHFFHLETERQCSQNGKSMVHLQIQLHCEKLLPIGECQLESPLPSIGRIADVLWKNEKIVFEIQCSPITAEEILARTKNYASIGYQTVWILHDLRYNKRRLSAAELILQRIPHYYTNINSQGKGVIYDQFELFDRGLRQLKDRPLPIHIQSPIRPYSPRSNPSLSLLSTRLNHWSLHFKGDLIDLSNYSKHENYLKQLLEKEKSWIPLKEKNWKTFWRRCREKLKRPFIIAFRLMLENSCK